MTARADSLRGCDARPGVQVRIVGGGDQVWTVWSPGPRPGTRWLVTAYPDGRRGVVDVAVAQLRSLPAGGR